MDKKRVFIIQTFLFTISSLFAQTEPLAQMPDKKKIMESIAQIPVSFRQNVGQWDEKILFQGSSPAWGATISFMKDGLSMGFSQSKTNGEKTTKGIKQLREYLVWNLNFKDHNPDVLLSTEGKEDSHANYLIGKDVSKHKINVPDYQIIQYNDIYKDIDVKYYSNGKALEYDFVLRPNADISQIKMECDGIKKLNINKEGQLEITTAWGTLMEEIPESYQMVNGVKKAVKINYRKIDDKTFGFVAEENYDHAMALVIDPINLAYGTFVGGPGDGYISDIAVDPSGCLYGTGWYNAVFPTTPGSYQPGYAGGSGYGDAYIFKLNKNATAYLYATYLGGAISYEQGEGIQVNNAGEAYVCGWTQSPDFPTTPGAYNQNFTAYPGNCVAPSYSSCFQDIFVVKLNAAGSALQYSTLIGSCYSDYAYALALNAAGEVYITGNTSNSCTDFPTTPGAYQSSTAANAWGAYVLKLNATGSALIFSTLTGNNGTAYAIAIDPAGNSYIAGEVYGNMTTTPGAIQTTPSPMINVYQDMFVQKIDPTGSSLVYSTYLGGNNIDQLFYGDGITADAAGNAYVTGSTMSTDFPTTPGAFNTTATGGQVFLSKINPTGTAFVYSTFLFDGGQGESVAVNAAGEAWVAGNSGNLNPTPCANFTSSGGGGTGGGGDCFVTKVDAAGANILYSSYFGGSGSDYGNGPFGKVKLVLWKKPCEDEVFVCTTSHSSNFPTTSGTVQPVKANGGADQPVVFHLKPSITPNFSFAVNCNVVNFTDLSSGFCIWKPGPWVPNAWTWHFGDGVSATTQNPSHTYASPGTYTVTLIVQCPIDSIKIPVTVSPGLVLSTTMTNSGCSGSTGSATVAVTSGSGPFTYTWSPAGGNAASTTNNLPPGLYTVTVSNGSCTNKDTITIGSTGVPPVTSTITGSSPVCPNATGIVYSVTNTPGSTYNWSVPAGATITAGQGTNSITVNFGATGGTITCTETNGCGTGTPVSINVATSTTPVTSPISGPSPVCANATNTTYSVISTTGSTYAWTVPSGATIVSGQGTNVIVVNWGGTGGNVGVTETSTCGTGSLVTTTVVISNAPVSSAIAGTTPICPNATNTTYSVISHPASTYTWSAPATATITAGQNTNSINVNWGTSGGVITVTESNSCGTGAPVTFIVVMNTVPVTSAITGSTTVCANSTQINYSVSNVPGNTYNWTVTGGGSIVLGQGSNSVFVNWGSTGGTVSVTQTNACGTGTAGTATVIVVNPVATGTITGTTPICPNTINTTYSVSNTIGSTYTWSVPATATITAGQNTNSVSVNWSSSGGVVTVTESNTCGSGTPVTFTVVMNASPNTGVIVGTTPVCPNATNLLYAVNNTPGSTYNWTVPSGASINSGQGSNSINVNWGTVAGNVSVVETNVCGTGTVVIYPVAVTSLAVTSPISGGNPSCANTNGITYSVTSGGTSYSWTVNGGGTIASGQGTNSININWGATGGIITCTEYNVCGAGNTVTDTVTFLNIPISTNIGGVNTVCPNQVGATYSVTSNATSTYSWSVTGGGTIVAGQTTNVIAVDWGASGGIVTCVESNMCGSGAPVSFTVVMNALPNTGAISGPSPVCANATNTTYSVVNTAGSTYVWIAPIGAIITSGQGSNIITINWNGSAGGNISVTETNSCGSGTVVVLPITVNAAPVVQITATPRNGCSPLAVTFSNTTVFTPGVTITSETWLFGDGNTSTVNNPTNVYVAAGGYNVSLTLTTNSGCTSTFSAVNFVNVYPNPHADFTYDPNTIYISEPTVHFADNSQLNIATWHWNLGDNTVLSTPNPVHSYNDAGTYTVVLAVSNQYGCVDTARKIITVKEDFNFYIPNAFTPNGDGNDDFFTGLGTAIGDFEMMIFDRWGNLVYKSNDYNQPWDGKLKQKGDIVQEDVYVYKIRVTEQDTRHEHVFNGHVSLLK